MNMFPSSRLITIVFVLMAVSINAQTPRTAEDFNKRGLQNLKKGKYEDAVKDFTQAVELSSHLISNGQLKRRMGNFSNSYNSIDKGENESIRVIDPRTAAALVNRGHAYMSQGDIDKAIDDFNQALNISPAFALAYFSRGTVWAIKKNLRLALMDYDKLLRIDAKFVAGFLGRGAVRIDMNDVDGAFADFNRALIIDPDNVGAFYQRGSAYWKTGDYDKALNDFDYALKLNPRHA